MKEQQLLRDSNIAPTGEIIAGALGTANSAYIKFLEELNTHDLSVDWRYYNDGKAWLGKVVHKWTTSRGTQKEITAFWLSIWDSFFRISLFIPEKVRQEALNLPLGDEIKEMIHNAKQVGKLKFFPLVFDLNSDELFDEIYALANLRKNLR